ncbi:hypothetical protein [Streptomyces sp. NPDC005336]|uniref:hypothetical protein n=1 Tax=Streptomyces sp. NPDC005336 TaxID=3157035 RepID=UPI0033B726FF
MTTARISAAAVISPPVRRSPNSTAASWSPVRSSARRRRRPCLIKSSDAPGSVLAEHAALHDAVQDRVAELIGVYNPQLSADRRTRTATMAFALFKAGLELVLSHQGAEREAYIAEMKASLYGYLVPVLCTESAPTCP